MANFVKHFLNTNNLERRYQSTSMFLNSVAKEEYALRDSATNLPEPREVLSIGDLTAIGKIPAQCLVMNCRILVHEAFAAGTTIDLHMQSDFPAPGAIVIATGIVVEDGNVAIQVPLPTNGVYDTAGAELSGVNGNIWVGDNRGLFVVATLGGTDVDANDPKGQIEVVMDYSNFGTNTGSFTG